MILTYQQRILFSLFSWVLLSFFAPTFADASSFTWQAPYIGGFVGGGFGNNHSSTSTGSITSTSYFTTSPDINAVNNAGTWTKDPIAVMGGIQAGHDWVWKQAIYGIALDYSVLPLSSSNTTYNTYPDSSDQYSIYTSMRTNWLFTLRGRLGYQAMLQLPSLFYFTGGMALSRLRISNSFSDNTSIAGSGGTNTSQNQIGWVVGVGAEVATFHHLSVNIEYLYINLPSVKNISSISNSGSGFGISALSMTSPFTSTANFHASLLKIGLNYRFDE